MELLQHRSAPRDEAACSRLLNIAARARSAYEEETVKLRRLEHQKQVLPDNTSDQAIRDLVVQIEVSKTRCEMLKSEMQRANVEAEPARAIQAAREHQNQVAVATAEYERASRLVSECYAKMQQAERTVKELEEARVMNSRSFTLLQQDLAAKKSRLAALGVSL